MPGTVSAPKARRWPATERGHAEAGVGVDVGRADEALHQLVGDVVVLGQQLARAVDRDAVRAVRVDRGAEARGDQVEGLVPAGVAAVDARGEQAVLEAEGLAERRALRAEPAEVRRVLGVAGDGGAAAAVGGREHAAADAAIGAGGADRGGQRAPAGAAMESGRCQRFTAKRAIWNAYGMRMESIWPVKHSGLVVNAAAGRPEGANRPAGGCVTGGLPAWLSLRDGGRGEQETPGLDPERVAANPALVGALRRRRSRG